MQLELGLRALEETQRVEVDARLGDPLRDAVEVFFEWFCVGVRVDEEEPTPGLEPQRDEPELLQIPPSLFPRGAVMRRPSRPYVQAW